MPTSENRKLAAILFADIQDYTALMQKDEQQASILIRHFQQQLEEKVVSYNGQIVNFYGDGALCTFQIPIEAVRCAMALQSIFQNEPNVPVRIGIHSGTVTYEGDKIFGDSVNITSRIESMGVAGGILLSKKVRDEVKNNPDLKMQSLGNFEFKNVEEPMEVYALANEGLIVPKKENIQGKLKTKSSNIAKFWWAIPLFFLLAFGGYYYFQQGKATLPDEIQAARIAVLPYENNTNDSTLNVLGNMAADWITRNLMNLENTKVVQFDNVKDNLDYWKNQPNFFSEQTGAEKIIKGKFYQVGQELIFESQIMNAQTAEVVFVLPNLSGKKDNPSDLIDELSQRIAGYFASRASDLNVFTKAPKYQAFVALSEGHKYFGVDYEKARRYYRQAMELDSAYIGGYLFYAQTYANQGAGEITDSLQQLIQEKFKNPSRMDKLMLNGQKAQLYGNLKAEYQIAKEALSLDPKQFGLNYQLGYITNQFNKPQTTLSNCQQLDPANITFDVPVKRWWFGIYATAFMRLERYMEALDILRYVPPEVHRFEDLKAQIYVLQNQSDSLNLLIQEMENNGVTENQILARLFKIAYDYGAKGDTANQLKWGNRLLNRIKNRPESIELPIIQLANAYFITEDYENMLATYEQVKQKNGETWAYLANMGFAYAKMGNMEMVDTFLKKYQNLETPYSQGRYKYAQAMVYAGLGNKEEAMRLLRLAFKEGYGFGLWEYNYSYQLANLRGYPPFEEFVKPKG